jgi:tetratricopeptide (TPR) repeat protein
MCVKQLTVRGLPAGQGIDVVRKLNMKNIILLITLFPVCDLVAGTKCGDDQPYNPFAKVTVRYHNVLPYENIVEGAEVTVKDYLGKIRPYPKPLTLDERTFDIAEDAYQRGEYRRAATEYIKVYNLDKTNPFVINAIARTFYKLENQRGRSFRAYLDLMKIIENGYMDSEKYSVSVGKLKAKGQKVVVIDPWFLEAYWKLGTLYLDYQEYDKAVLEMSKMYYYEFRAHKDIPEADKGMAVQLFSYLTEAYFHLKNRNANAYFYCRTKEIDPANTFVEEFMIK